MVLSNHQINHLSQEIKMLGKFRNEITARSFSNQTIKTSVIVLGDDNRYWVVTMAEWSKLEKQGYEAI